MAGITKASDKEYLERFELYRENFRNSTPINPNETQALRLTRVRHLESHPEEWFKYYFSNYCTAEPAQFHIAATKRFLTHKEWFEVRAWSRELAKSSRSMMEIIYLALRRENRNALVVSNTHENAKDLLAPFKACFECNQRIIQDYGVQQTIGKWKDDKFTIKNGCSFRALGWGESPRGTRNNEKRPDLILIDDFDTDEECRNADIMKKKIEWMEQALIPTRSISEPTRILVNGNIIHENCMVNYLGNSKFCDKFDIVNIRGTDGKSSWPSKNSEAYIDRVLSIISYESGQKEYFNNPMDGGDIFKELKIGRIPSLRSCMSLIYADPATSNKDVTSGSYKAVGCILYKNFCYYIAKVKLDTMSSMHFVESLYDVYEWAINNGADSDLQVWIENNSLQDPFYQQVLLPLIYEEGKRRNKMLPVIPDTRDKKDKYIRIEGLLEPIHRAGQLVFNEKESDDPDMKRLIGQFKGFKRTQKRMDGPDMVEGGVYRLKTKACVEASDGIISIRRTKTIKI